MEQQNLDNWDGFLGSNFLKAEDLENEDQIFVCVGVEMDQENERPMLILETDEKKTKFGLNVTNSNFVKNTGIKSPTELIGKKIQFRIVQAFSPKAKKEVDSLRISKVE